MSQEPFDSPEYQKFLEDMAKTCKCADAPCDGCLAGAPCDADTYGDGTHGWSLFNKYEDDEDEEDEQP